MVDNKMLSDTDKLYIDKLYMEKFWPAQRARNFVKKLKLHTGRPLTREGNLELLANKIGVSLDVMKTMGPLEFCEKLRANYEIQKSGLNYASTVMGLQHLNEVAYWEQIAKEYRSRVASVPAKH
jgi:hypothetical protein